MIYRDGYMNRLLWISMCAPIPKSRHGGGQTFHYYFKRMLETKEWEITLISKILDSEIDYQDTIPCGYKNIYLYKSKGLRRILDIIVSIPSKLNPNSRYGDTLLFATYLDYKRKISELAKNGYKPDVIILEWGQMLPLLDFLKSIFPGAKIVSSEHDVMCLGYFRRAESEKNSVKKIYRFARYKSIRKNELLNLSKCDLVFTHNTKDLDILSNENVTCELDWLVPKFSIRSNTRAISLNNQIVFFGDMSRPENYLSAIWFIDNVMPKLDTSDIEFLIIGNAPHPDLLSRNGRNIKVLGFVDDLDAIFSSCLCLVAPLLLGAGIKIKIIEAMASGVPVVTNDIGIEGIPAVDGRDYIHCEKPEEYVSAIKTMISNSEYVKSISENGRNCIIKSFNMDDSFLNYNGHIKSIVNN